MSDREEEGRLHAHVEVARPLHRFGGPFRSGLAGSSLPALDALAFPAIRLAGILPGTITPGALIVRLSIMALGFSVTVPPRLASGPMPVPWARGQITLYAVALHLPASVTAIRFYASIHRVGRARHVTAVPIPVPPEHGLVGGLPGRCVERREPLPGRPLELVGEPVRCARRP